MYYFCNCLGKKKEGDNSLEYYWLEACKFSYKLEPATYLMHNYNFTVHLGHTWNLTTQLGHTWNPNTH